MGKSNLLHGLETKIGKLMGELAAKREEIERVEKLAEQLAAMRERVWELEMLIEATETLIKSDHPDWQRDTIDLCVHSCIKSRSSSGTPAASRWTFFGRLPHL